MAAAADPAAPEVTGAYLICATPRTGSYLLCGALAATGVAGRPTEYLMPKYREYWSERWDTSDYATFHRRIVAEGTTANGIFGTKIHSGQFLPFLQQATGRARVAMEDRPAIVDEWFHRPRYLWLRRRDAVRQAVSWSRATQTSEWWDTDAPPVPLGTPTPEKLRFDYAGIERAMYALADWDGVWRTYFASTGIVPHTVWYEDLVADRDTTVDGILDHLGLERGPADETVSEFRRQSDGTSSVWADLFTRLHDLRTEGTLAALAGLHAGETIVVCTGGPIDGVDRTAVTISVDGAPSPAPATYALCTRPPTGSPAAGVVVAAGPWAVTHPYVVRALVGEGRNHLPEADGGPGVALARHLGAANVEVV